jgi:hypothetical protein
MSEITKRRVTMRNVVFAGTDDNGQDVFHEHGAVDYVHPEHLDVYVADAEAKGWKVQVADEPDAGPGGWGGEYTLPAHLNHPDAGVTRPAQEV